jgi:hypothetical protein
MQYIIKIEDASSLVLLWRQASSDRRVNIRDTRIELWPACKTGSEAETNSNSARSSQGVEE